MGILSNEQASSTQDVRSQSGQYVLNFAPGEIVMTAGRGGYGGKGGRGGDAGTGGTASGGLNPSGSSKSGKGGSGTGGAGAPGAPGAVGGNAIYETQFPQLESINVGFTGEQVGALLEKSQSYVERTLTAAQGYVQQGQKFTGETYAAAGEATPAISSRALGIGALLVLAYFYFAKGGF